MGGYMSADSHRCRDSVQPISHHMQKFRFRKFCEFWTLEIVGRGKLLLTKKIPPLLVGDLSIKRD
jgi:hypothetical protein